jgi:hypothetical protein
MRQAKRSLTRRVNGDLRLEIGDDRLTSHAGLELFGRYLRGLRFSDRVRRAFAATPIQGDYTVPAMMRLLLVMLWVGARRLRHVRFLSHDPMVLRVAELQRLPEERTLSRWLGRFHRQALRAIAAINTDLVMDTVRRLCLRTLTIDLDGTVVSTGLSVNWAFRGYNPHHRKVPSYFPILAHLAETSQILAVKNRPGNVHDGRQAVSFLRDLLRLLRGRLGRRVRLQFCMDGAFFQRQILETLDAAKVDFAIKVPMWRWLDLKSRIQLRQRWEKVTAEVSAFEMWLPIPQWNQTCRVVCYRKKVFHPTAKNFQLDLFSPDDGTYEYSTVATSMTLDAAALWHFMAGRGAQEKTIAELKDGFAFDTIPTKKYAANSAWQWLSVLAHNLHRAFQLSITEEKRRRSPKKTFLYRLESIKSSRFEWLNTAGRLLRLSSGLTLRLPQSSALEKRFQAWPKSA